MSIQGYFVLLIQNLDVEAILPFLKQARMVTFTEYEQVSSAQLTLKQKRDKLLLLLTKKGPNHYRYFCWCIVWSGQRALAERMRIDLSSVPRSIDDVFPSTTAPFVPFPSGGAIPVTATGPSLIPNPCLPVVPKASQPLSGTSQPDITRETPANPTPSTVAPAHPLNVLLLYCKDPALSQCGELGVAYQRSAEQYCEEILDLADTLNRFSAVTGTGGQAVKGFECTYDGYDGEEMIDNWLRWTDDKLREADCVLLACSPTLISNLLSSSTIHMKRASCAVNSLFNTMPKKPFYPVFLNMPKQSDWIPTQLKSSSCFELHISTFYRAMGNVEDEDLFYQRAYHLFDTDSQFEDLLSLLRMLRRELTRPPDPPDRPTSLPNPSFDAGTFISEETLQELAKNVGLRWQELSLKLGIPYSDMELIRMQHPHLASRVIAIVHQWKASKGQLATRRRLKEVIIHLRYRELATKLFPND